MKVILFILPLCLFTTFSTKRAGNLNQLISSKIDAHLHITDEEEERNNIHRHSVKLDNIFMLTLIDDDGSGSLKSRQLLSGLPGSFSPIVTKKNAPIHTENHYTEIYTDRPSQLFNKGSPNGDITGIHNFSINLKNKHCLFTLLHFHFPIPTLCNEAIGIPLGRSLYLGITRLWSFLLAEHLRLFISVGLSFSGASVVNSFSISIFEKLLFPP